MEIPTLSVNQKSKKVYIKIIFYKFDEKVNQIVTKTCYSKYKQLCFLCDIALGNEWMPRNP